MGQWKGEIALCACLGDDSRHWLGESSVGPLWPGLAGHGDPVQYRTKILPLDSSIAYDSSLLVRSLSSPGPSFGKVNSVVPLPVVPR